ALGSSQQAIEFDRLQLRFYAPAQVQQSTRHFHAPVGSISCLDKTVVQTIFRIERIQRQLDIPQNHSELVVQIVRNKTGQGAQGLEVAFFSQPFFEFRGSAFRQKGIHGDSMLVVRAERGRAAQPCVSSNQRE